MAALMANRIIKWTSRTQNST